MALSRAKERLVIVANLAFLDAHLPGNALLRDVLTRCRRPGAWSMPAICWEPRTRVPRRAEPACSAPAPTPGPANITGAHVK